MNSPETHPGARPRALDDRSPRVPRDPDPEARELQDLALALRAERAGPTPSSRS